MSSTDTEPKIDPDTGLVEGLDPGTSQTDKTPEQRSEPIPTSHGSRLVGKTDEEVAEILAAEEKEKADAAAAEAKVAAGTTSSTSSKSTSSSS